MSCIFHYNVGETIQSFFERPFVKHYSSKDPDNVFINKIIERWNFRYPEQKVEEDFVKKLLINQN